MLPIYNRNILENKSYRSFKSLVGTRRQSLMSSKSASARSTEQGVFDSDNFLDFEFSTSSRSRSSTSENSVSGVYSSLFNSDMNSSRRQSKDEQRSARDYTISKDWVTKVSEATNNGRLNVADDSFGMTVIGDGTRLMNDILFPTVIVWIPEQKLLISTLYYIVLEPLSGMHSREIPCLLYSTVMGHKKDEQTAELLPLRMVSSRTKFGDISLSPLLLHEHNRFYFQEGCKFKVKAIKAGRHVNRKQSP
jgi:hypothetical protein